MRALLLVDLQNDFLPGGSLAVPEADQVIPVANRLVKRFEHVVASKDWHPEDHTSFVDNHDDGQVGQTVTVDGLEQVLWPRHCVQDTEGAEFPDRLDTAAIDHVVLKGTEPRIDSYSAFYDNGHRRSTGLADHLRKHDIDELFVLGLATDVCVKFTVLDALEEGFKVNLVVDGTRGVDLEQGDTERAIRDMTDAGARPVQSRNVPYQPPQAATDQ